MGLLKNKYRSSTLLETLIAMVVIIICFSIGMMIFSNVTSSANYRQTFHANLILQNISLQTQTDKEYFDKEYIIENFKIKKIITNYGSSRDLKQLTLRAYNQNEKMIATRHEIILVTP